MKKTIFTVLLIALIVFSSNIGKALTGITVNHGMLAFNTKAIYIALVGEYTQEQKADFVTKSLETPDFISLLKTKKANAALYAKIDDDFFSAIISEKGYVQIENFIYKLNPYDELVYVFPSGKFDLIPIIDAGNLTDPDIKTYSMKDDVIGMVSSGTPPSNAKLFCGESGVGERTKTGHIDCTDASNKSQCNWMDCSVMYNALGIYFALKAKCINTSPCRTMYWHKTPAAYKVKCGYTYGSVYQWDIPSGALAAPDGLGMNIFIKMFSL